MSWFRKPEKAWRGTGTEVNPKIGLGSFRTLVFYEMLLHEHAYFMVSPSEAAAKHSSPLLVLDGSGKQNKTQTPLVLLPQTSETQLRISHLLAPPKMQEFYFLD